MLSVGGVRLDDLVAEHGSPAYVLDETDFRTRARAFKEAFAAYDVFYAGKAFLYTATATWAAEEGLNLDVCTGGGASGRRAGRHHHGQRRVPRQQQERGRASGPSPSASAGSSWTRSTRSSGWPRSPMGSAAPPVCWCG